MISHNIQDLYVSILKYGWKVVDCRTGPHGIVIIKIESDEHMPYSKVYFI